MSIYEFHLLTEDEQLHQLWSNGMYIGKRRHHDYTYILFQLDAFYVELSYRKYRTQLCRVHCTRSTNILDPYLHFVEVEVLANY